MTVIGEPESPFDSVFTTIPWDGNERVAFAKMHMKRWREHAERLNIDWPENMNLLLKSALENIEPLPECDNNRKSTPLGLLKLVLYADGSISVRGRQNNPPNSPGSAIVVEAIRWPKQISATKHGAWKKIKQARFMAHTKGADIAFLAHDGIIIDADRATPVILDNDGTAWINDQSEGGVDSITLELVMPYIKKMGIPIQQGRLNERLFARANEIIVVGSGVGILSVTSLDGEYLGIYPEGNGPMNKHLTTKLDATLNTSWSNMAYLHGGLQ